MEPSRERDGVVDRGAAHRCRHLASMEPSRERDGVLVAVPRPAVLTGGFNGAVARTRRSVN